MVFIVGAKMDTEPRYRAEKICQKPMVLTAFETQEHMAGFSGLETIDILLVFIVKVKMDTERRYRAKKKLQKTTVLIAKAQRREEP